MGKRDQWDELFEALENEQKTPAKPDRVVDTEALKAILKAFYSQATDVLECSEPNTEQQDQIGEIYAMVRKLAAAKLLFEAAMHSLEGMFERLDRRSSALSEVYCTGYYCFETVLYEPGIVEDYMEADAELAVLLSAAQQPGPADPDLSDEEIPF